jgi:hypothetical protein
MFLRFRALFALLVLTIALTLTRAATALPQAKLLRVDPRAGMTAGAPVLTTLIELGQFRPLSDVLGACTETRNRDALYDCMGDAVEKPNALWEPFQFPDTAANLLVRVEGSESPAKFVSRATWKDAQRDTTLKGMGTAWLIALDASSSMGARYADGREVVVQFVQQMGPQDLVRLILFDDRDQAFTADSKWKSFKERNDIITKVLNVYQSNAPSAGQSRAIFNTVKNVLTTGFNDLGNVGTTEMTIPVHQAFVVLSNGAGRQDALSNQGGGEKLKEVANQGRFPEGNSAAPKAPLPIISILFPNSTQSMTNSFMANNDVQFMQALANVETGGFFSVVRSGQGKARGERIAKAVKSRFNAMTVVKWKLSCLNPTVEQSFNLTFRGMKQPVQADGSFKNVPIGVDPAEWPLDINVEQTKQEAETNPVYPGGTFKVYGDFCWEGDKARAEAYFLPAGFAADPSNRTADAAKKLMSSLISQNLRGAAVDANASFVTLQVPPEEKLLDGAGGAMTARVVIFDNRAKRASSTDEHVLTLRAKKAPLPLLLIGGIVGGVLVLGLIIMLLMRGGNKRGGKGGGGGTPQPVVAYNPGGGYGAPPGGGYGGPPPGGGGGYGGPPGGGYGGPPPGGGYGGPPPGGGARYDGASVAPAAVAPTPPRQEPNVSMQDAPHAMMCPSCGMSTMVSARIQNVCFACGKLVDLRAAERQGGGAGDIASTFPAHFSRRGVPTSAESVWR